jgi:predicted nucleic acid-binding protein
MDLVVDTWVWETAQSTDGQDSSFQCVELLSILCRTSSNSVLLDYEDEIRKEYESHIRDKNTKYFYQTMTARGRFKYRGRTTIRLRNRFDPDDMKFVEVAYVHPRSPIVSGDSDFMELRRNIQNEPAIPELRILSHFRIVIIVCEYPGGGAMNPYDGDKPSKSTHTTDWSTPFFRFEKAESFTFLEVLHIQINQCLGSISRLPVAFREPNPHVSQLKLLNTFRYCILGFRWLYL